MPALGIVAFQRRPIFNDVPDLVRTLARDLSWEERQGVNLAVFPACYLQGHATDRRTLERRALSVSDPAIIELLTQLGEAHATAVIGMVERRGDTLLNTALVAAAGKLIGIYSKVHPNEDGITPGCEYPVFSTRGWCFEAPSPCPAVGAAYPLSPPGVGRDTGGGPAGAGVRCGGAGARLLGKRAGKAV
jgi:predicted amidohydrolase